MATIGTILTAGFDSASQGSEFRITYGGAATTTFYAGALVCINGSGYAIPVPACLDSVDNSALKVVGQCVREVTTVSAGDPVTVRTNCAVTLNNIASDLVVQGDVGAACYATSDNQVCHTQANGSGKAPKAGTVVGTPNATTVLVYLNANATV